MGRECKGPRRDGPKNDGPRRRRKRWETGGGPRRRKSGELRDRVDRVGPRRDRVNEAKDRDRVSAFAPIGRRGDAVRRGGREWR